MQVLPLKDFRGMSPRVPGWIQLQGAVLSFPILIVESWRVGKTLLFVKPITELGQRTQVSAGLELDGNRHFDAAKFAVPHHLGVPNLDAVGRSQTVVCG
jgi:hypothetical protein